MTEPRYPNESRQYRAAREALLKEEQELVEKTRAVAAKRRNLPPGGQLKEDYTFQWANDGKLGSRVKFSELFGDKDTLILYSFMFGPNWDKPCPSCTSLMDGFDRTLFGRAGRSVRRGRQGPGRSDRQVPGRERRPAAAGDAGVQEARRQDFPVLEHRGDVEPRRYGLAVLESHGLHAGGTAGPADTAAAVQERVFGEELFE